MEYTLVLRLAAPFQAWGSESKFDIRKTGREPTKSGVVGMLTAAMGRRRDDSVEDLNSLRMGVRVDREGIILRDFHMARKIEAGKLKESYLTNRYYLSDAVFVVGLEGEDRRFLEYLANQINYPSYPLFLGRRSCPPTLPIVLGVEEKRLEDALADVPNQDTSRGRKKDKVRMIIEVRDLCEKKMTVQDVPVSFNPENRRYSYRNVCEKWLESSVLFGTAANLEEKVAIKDNENNDHTERRQTTHDAFLELLEEKDVSVKS